MYQVSMLRVSRSLAHTGWAVQVPRPAAEVRKSDVYSRLNSWGFDGHHCTSSTCGVLAGRNWRADDKQSEYKAYGRVQCIPLLWRYGLSKQSYTDKCVLSPKKQTA